MVLKILIAEDDLTSSMILKKVVAKWGYEPICVANGETAWDIMQADDAPKLLLLDWEMPELSGVELCRRIREHEQGDPSFIILLTSRSSTDDIVTGLEAGSNEYIAKPFDQTELQARLQVGRRMIELQENQRNAERAKERLQRELQQIRKMEALGQIAGGIAHDFNNILGIIMGYTNMAIDRYGDDVPEQMLQYLKTAMKSSERAKKLVAKMLVFTEGEEKEIQPLQLVSQIQHELEPLKANLPNTISIKFTYEDDLPIIFLGPDKLRQILSILCDNAKDAMNDKGKITISVKIVKILNEECNDCHKLLEGEWVELAVADNGCGMTPQVIEHIFEPFFTMKEYGKGMGMAMLHGIISRNGRHSIIESQENEGTKVKVLFPFNSRS